MCLKKKNGGFYAVYGDVFGYEMINDNEVKITLFVLYYFDSYNVIIPDEIDSKSVTELAEYSFCEIGLNESIQLPKNLKIIGRNVFIGNNLTEAVIPESVERVEKDAFSHQQVYNNEFSGNGLENFSFCKRGKKEKIIASH